VSSGPFSGRATWLLAAIAAGSLGIGSLIAVFADEARPARSPAPDAFSTSALGHKAFVELLRAEGFQVLVNRRREARAPNAAWVFAEPRVWESRRLTDGFRALLADAPRALLVLPKRQASPLEGRPDWTGPTSLLDTGRVEQVLAEADLAGAVVRLASGGEAWAFDTFPAAPELEDVQLVSSDWLAPLIACDAGVLLGRLPGDGDGPGTLVLTDPDLIATHGLVRGRNAELAVEIARRLAPPGTPLVLDATVHGYSIQPSLWKSLLTFPLALASLHAALAAALFLWTAMGRFGAPEPAGAGIAAGKRALIDNVAELLLATERFPYVLRQYHEDSLARVAAACHLDRGAQPGQLLERLDALARGRGTNLRPGDLDEAVRRALEASAGQGSLVASAARRIRRWEGEMLRGSASHS